MKKYNFLLLVLIVSLNACGNSTSLNENGGIVTDARCADINNIQGYDNNSGVWEIYNTNGLSNFRDAVNNGSVNTFATLICDINLGSFTNWIPIGNYARNIHYVAMFDGNNKTIRNLSITTSATEYRGLFSSIGNGGTIKNLVVNNPAITGSIGVGVITAVNAGTIDNVSVVNGTVTNANNSTGGIAGVNIGTISSSYNSSNILNTTTSNNIGGIAGINDTTGIVVSSYNTGNITTSNTSFNIGGVVGTNSNIVASTHNTGRISSGYMSTNIGGVIGNNSAGTLSASYNNGTIISDNDSNNIGGVVGVNGTNAFLVASYNTAPITSDENSKTIGGVVGYNAGEITANYNVGNITSDPSITTIGGVVGGNAGTVFTTFYLLVTSTTSRPLSGIGEPASNTNATSNSSIDSFKDDSVINALNNAIGTFETNNSTSIPFIFDATTGGVAPLVLQSQ